jgi:hypothetical protein
MNRVYPPADTYRQPSDPPAEDFKAAAPYRGQTLQVITLDFNRDRDEIIALLETYEITAGFGLYPALQVKAVDQRGARLPQDGRLVAVAKKKGGL